MIGRARACAAAVLSGCLCGAAMAANDYQLAPVAVADGVYAFIGRSENFGRGNGGNIVNSGFIVGTDGVIVIDTGPSKAYGEQQRAAIARVTALPITRVFITHAHPDHFLGDQAYPASVIAVLPATRAAIQANGEALSANLYRLVGGWMVDTAVVAPTVEAAGGDVSVAGRRLSLIAAAGHTAADLMIYDRQSRTLFAGDLVFYRRAPTTPNADIPLWLAALKQVDALSIAALVPGHGPIDRDHRAVAQTRDYLHWLQDGLQDAANRGLDMAEVMTLPLPPRFKDLAVIDSEYPRSIAHLYPTIELGSLPAVNGAAASARP